MLKSQSPCAVCAKVCSTRCDASEQLRMQVFFCSRDCQRLVWFAHKRVCGRSCVGRIAKLPSEPCGASTNPFSFPLLSKKHADEAISIAFVHSGGIEKGPSHIGRVFKDCLKCPPDKIEKMMARLTEGTDNPLTWARGEKALYKVYFYLFQVRKSRGIDATTPDEELPLDVFDPFPALGYYVHILNLGMMKNFTVAELTEGGGPQPWGWQTFLLHQALIFLAVRYKCRRVNRTSDPQVLRPYNVLCGWIEHELKPQNARLARVVKESLRALVKGSPPDGW